MAHTQKFLDKQYLFFEGKKRCIKCGETKSLNEFALDTHGRRFDGHDPRCNKCASLIHKKKYKENPTSFKLSTKRWENSNPEKVKAHRLVGKAVLNKKIKKPLACELCHEQKPLTAHHYLGYSEEHIFDIQWLCRSCHNSLSKHVGNYSRNMPLQIK